MIMGQWSTCENLQQYVLIFVNTVCPELQLVLKRIFFFFPFLSVWENIKHLSQEFFQRYSGYVLPTVGGAFIPSFFCWLSLVVLCLPFSKIYSNRGNLLRDWVSGCLGDSLFLPNDLLKKSIEYFSFNFPVIVWILLCQMVFGALPGPYVPESGIHLGQTLPHIEEGAVSRKAQSCGS